MIKGREYETYIKDGLKNLGYDAYTTATTGDFGTDIIIKVNKYFKIILQCKYYSSTVGLHAVQEIVAAKEYYGAQLCGVITNSTFTTPAVNLAIVNDVLLIDKFDFGRDVLDICKEIGLIPSKYVAENQLRINDAESEKSWLIEYTGELKREISDLKDQIPKEVPLCDSTTIYIPQNSET